MICLEEVGKTDASPRKEDLYFVRTRSWPSTTIASYTDTAKAGKYGCSLSKLLKLNNRAFFCWWHNYVSEELWI